MGALEWMKIAQDPRKRSMQGRKLRVGITSTIQHAELLDAREQNRTEQNRTERNRKERNETERKQTEETGWDSTSLVVKKLC